MLWIVLLVLFLASPSYATTYYVATTGNDTTGDGSIGNPWATINKCVQTSGNPSLAPGDTCSIGNGTYAPAANSAVSITSSVSPNGTNGNPITLKSTNPLGAVIQFRTSSNSNQRGIHISGRQYWIIEGFDIHDDGNAANTGTSVSLHGIYIEGTAAGNITIRKNTIHNVGRATCSNSSFGFTGIFVTKNGSNYTIENNVFHTIGRLRNGESGCSTTISQHDHAIYVESGGTNVTIRRNIIYDTNRGYAIHVYAGAGGTNTGLKIYNNTMRGQSPGGFLPAAGQILLANSMNNVEIKNNLCSDVKITCINTSSVGTWTNVSVTHNRQDVDDTSGDNFFNGTPPAGTTTSNNTDNSAMGFVDAASNDYRLAAGSNAIDTGTNVSLPFNGSAPDQGAFETLTFTGGTATGTIATVTAGMSLNTPIQCGVMGGYTINVAGSNRGTSSIAANGSSSCDVTFDGAALTAGQAVTVTYNQSPGTAADSALIGGTLNQPIWDVGPVTLTNLAAGASYTITQTAGAVYDALGLQDTTSLIRGVRPGALIAVRTKKKCTGAACPTLTYKPRAATDSENGTYADVPDAFGTANIKFVGLVPISNLAEHATQITVERLASEFSGVTTGAVVRCGPTCQVPAMALAQDSEGEMVWIFEIDTDAVVGTQYWIREYQEDGTALTYAANSTPTFVIIGPTAHGGG